MVYKVIAIDVFNLYFRRLSSCLEKDTISIANNVISCIETEFMPHLEKGGDLYLLFDPIPLNDLGISNTFKYQTTRQKVVSNYKLNRKHDKNALSVIEIVRKYFSHRGEHIREVISDEYEADDYVESIVAKYQNDDIALITNDEDWARYISDKVHMINDSFNKPFTSSDFFKKYNFYPTASSVSMFKACFGDVSDNITGALMVKKVHSVHSIKKLGFEYIQELSKSNDSVDDIIKRIKAYSFMELDKLGDKRTKEQEFIYEIISIDPKYEVESTLFDNLRVIKSACNDFSKFSVWKPIDEKFNVLLENSLGRSKVKKRPFRFGGIHAK